MRQLRGAWHMAAIRPAGKTVWALPKGLVGRGEDPAGTAVREVSEETGVEIAVVRFRGISNDVWQEDGKHNITIWLEADHAAGEPRLVAPEESDAVDWFPRDALPSPLYRSLENYLSGRTYPPLPGAGER